MKEKKNIIIVNSNVFQREELAAFENRILENQKVTEHEASEFFLDFPKFLCIGGYYQIAREVVIYAGDKPIYRVDFFRRQYGDKYWDIVELKSPMKPFVIKKGGHWKFSAEIEAGIHQATDYKDSLENEMNRFLLEERTGIRAYRPKILLVGGRKSDIIDPFELRRLGSRFGATDIKAYDDLYSFALENYDSSLIVVPVMQNSDIPSPVQRMFFIDDKDANRWMLDLSPVKGIKLGVLTNYACPMCNSTKTFCNWSSTSDFQYHYDIYWHVCGECHHIKRINEKVVRDYSIMEELDDPTNCPLCKRRFPS